MKKRKIYYRRKQGKIIAEGKIKNKTIFLFTLPEPEKLVKSSLFTQEKRVKIMEKINRLDKVESKKRKVGSEVRTTAIMGNSQKDDFEKITIEDLEEDIEIFKKTHNLETGEENEK